MNTRVMMRMLVAVLGTVLGAMLDASAAAQSDDAGARSPCVGRARRPLRAQ